jgi:hypothetical protein
VKRPKGNPRAVLLGVLALVVLGVLVKLAVSDQGWPDSHVLGRALFILLVAGAIPLALWLIRRRRR